MTNMDDSFSVSISELDLAAPPRRWPVPLEHAGPIPMWSVVSVRRGAGRWMIDQHVTITDPDNRDEVGVAPIALIGAQRAGTPGTQGSTPGFWAKKCDVVVWRDGPAQTLEAVHPPAPWLARTVSDGLPTVLSPQPVASLPSPSLVSRTLRLLTDEGVWIWVVAMSEPTTDASGDITVHVSTVEDYWESAFGADPETIPAPVHHLWVY